MMAQYKVTWNNSVGPLDDLVLNTVPELGLGLGRFTEALREMVDGAALQHGDSFTIERIKEAPDGTVSDR